MWLINILSVLYSPVTKIPLGDEVKDIINNGYGKNLLDHLSANKKEIMGYTIKRVCPFK